MSEWISLNPDNTTFGPDPHVPVWLTDGNLTILAVRLLSTKTSPPLDSKCSRTRRILPTPHRRCRSHWRRRDCVASALKDLTHHAF